MPVIKNAGDLNIAGLARGDRRPRRPHAQQQDHARTSSPAAPSRITNTGSRGALFDTPIINQPQVAILGTGAVVKRPVVVTDADGGETIAIRSMVLPRAVLRPPHRRRRGCRPLPHHDEDPARGGRLRGRPGPLRSAMPQRVAITGSSGLIGGALSAFLSARGDEVVHLVRRPARTAAEISWDPTSRVLDPRALDGVDAVVNLAGAGVGDKRWTPADKQEILASRVDGTAHARHRPGRGRPPDPAGEPVRRRGSTAATAATRSSPRSSEKGHGFLAEVVRAWEAAARAGREPPASASPIPAPASSWPPARAPWGRCCASRSSVWPGPLGSGRQYWPWITLHDAVRALAAPGRPPGHHRAGQRRRPGAGPAEGHRGRAGPAAAPPGAAPRSRHRRPALRRGVRQRHPRQPAGHAHQARRERVRPRARHPAQSHRLAARTTLTDGPFSRQGPAPPRPPSAAVDHRRRTTSSRPGSGGRSTCVPPRPVTR